MILKTFHYMLNNMSQKMLIIKCFKKLNFFFFLNLNLKIQQYLIFLLYFKSLIYPSAIWLDFQIPYRLSVIISSPELAGYIAYSNLCTIERQLFEHQSTGRPIMWMKKKVLLITHKP